MSPIPLDFPVEESVHAVNAVTGIRLRRRPTPGLLAGLWAVEAPASGRRATMEAHMPKTQTPTPKLTDTQLAAYPSRKPKKASSSASTRQPGSAQSKQDLVIQMLRRQSGVSIDDIITKTGWQPHSVRGFFSGLVRKKLKLPLVSDVGKDGVRRYHIASVASSKA